MKPFACVHRYTELILALGSTHARQLYMLHLHVMTDAADDKAVRVLPFYIKNWPQDVHYAGKKPRLILFFRYYFKLKF